MTTPRRSWLAEVVLTTTTCFVAASALYFWLYPAVFPAGVFSRHNYDRVRAGMTLNEVEALLGPGIEVGPERVVADDPDGLKGGRFFRWEGDSTNGGPYTSTIVVGFCGMRVCDKHYHDRSVIAW